MTISIVGRGIVGTRAARILQLGQPERRLGPHAAGDVVVLAHPGHHAPAAAELVAAGVQVVSLSDDLDDVRQLLDLDDACRLHGTSLVVGAGMEPGLSGLLARLLADQLAVADEIHVAVHGTAGPACARQHHRALGGSALGWHDGAWIERRAGSGRELCWFPEPVGPRDCYRAEIPTPLTVQRAFPQVERITARMSANRRDRLTANLPMLVGPHPEGGVGALRVEVRGADAAGGRVSLVSGIAEFVGAAAAATAAAFAVALDAGELAPGVVVPGDASLDTIGLLHRIERFGVRLQEFAGDVRVDV
ncbi:MAG: hypothetical protein MUE78_03075 [Ilumatobacteraceae bacterium]|nr:hypothetical protein [Ilumatobacteraceae bacterium]